MFTDSKLISRRHFTRSLAAAGGLLALPKAWADEKPASEKEFAFFFVSDSHYYADKENTSRMDPRCVDVTANFIDTLNKLPGTEIPAEAGGGKVRTPIGVIHGGDLIESGDRTGRQFEEMQQTEWNHFEADYGLNGAGGRLKYPVYEVHGNHDSPGGGGLAVKKIIERNRQRKGITNVCGSGLHYSWDWGPVHFVNLGITVGSGTGTNERRRYNPFSSLEFLQADLKERVGSSGRPVIITHHVHIRPKVDPQKPVKGEEWDPDDIQKFRAAWKDYNIAAIFYGHTHGRVIWNWQNDGNETGVYNVSKCSHFSSNQQAFFYVEFTGGELVVRECKTTDRWATHQFHAETWKRKVSVPAAVK